MAQPLGFESDVRVTRRPRDQRRLDVLVLDAEYRQALALVRSFGRMGLRVGTVVCQSQADGAVAARSRYSRLTAVVPDFSADPDRYVDALLQLLDSHPAALIVPCHDGSIEALRTRREHIERRVALPLASEASLSLAVDKTRTLALARELGILVPRAVEVDSVSDVAEALKYVGCPAVVKPVWSWAQHEGVGTRLSCRPVSSRAQAEQAVSMIEAAGGRALLQQWLPGRRDAVSLFYAHRRFVARFAQTSHRELPALGGASVLCESLPLLPDIIAPSERLIEAMGLEGCSMVEFRRDADGRPVLMEVNPRMPGSSSLAMAAGVDFAPLLRRWALGMPLDPIDSSTRPVRLRWLAGDVANLTSALKTGRTIDVPTRRQALSTFVTDFVRRPARVDVFDASDLKPGWFECLQTARSAFSWLPRSVARVLHFGGPDRADA